MDWKWSNQTNRKKISLIQCALPKWKHQIWHCGENAAFSARLSMWQWRRHLQRLKLSLTILPSCQLRETLQLQNQHTNCRLWTQMRLIWCDSKSYMCRMKPRVKQTNVSSALGHLSDVCISFVFCFFWGDVIARLPGSIHLSLNLYIGKWKAHHASSVPSSADSALWHTLQDEFISAEPLHLWEIYEDVSFNWGPPSEVSSTLCVIDRRWHFIRWLFNLRAWQKSGTVRRLSPPRPLSRKQLL